MQHTSTLIQAFREKFTTPARVFFSPGRINLIGEHIDYNDGFVLPAAINKGIWFAIAANNTNTANFFAVDENDSFSVPLNHIQKQDGWKNYVLGILHILHRDGFDVSGFDCAFSGNVPQGAGLSSSAALEAGLLYALNDLFNLKLTTLQMALMAQQAEHSFPGTKCGIMDMFASLHGKKNHCLLLDCVSLHYEYFPLLFDDYEWVLINSKVKHSLNDGAYNKRREEAAEGLSFFQTVNNKIISYRSIKPAIVEQFKYALPADIFDRSLFITQEIERTQQAAKYLHDNKLAEFGKLMYDAHNGLSNLYKVSCVELDHLVAQAKKHPSVIGSRMMGGGFGGCTINLIEKKNREEVVESIVASYHDAFNIKPEVYPVETSDGTHQVHL